MLFTEQSLSLQLTVTETLIKVSRYHALAVVLDASWKENELLTYQLFHFPTSKQCDFFSPLC